MAVRPKFKVGDTVKFGKRKKSKKVEIFAICLKGDNILEALSLKLSDLTNYKIDVGSIVSSNDRYIIKHGNSLKSYLFYEFDLFGRLCDD